MTERIRIRLKAFDHWVVDQTAADIVRTAQTSGATVRGPIPLPTRRQRWTVLRSPHIDKKSREQFELRTHKRLIDIVDSRPQTIDALTKLDLPIWNNSSMDGFAFILPENFDINDESINKFIISGNLFPGDDYLPIVNKGEAIKIMTGAPMPPKANCVVPIGAPVTVA